MARGTQTVALHRGALSVLARRWSAIWETGAAIGVLDGVSSLQHSGLTGYEDDDVHLSVVHNHNTRLLPGVRAHPQGDPARRGRSDRRRAATDPARDRGSPRCPLGQVRSSGCAPAAPAGPAASHHTGLGSPLHKDWSADARGAR